MGHPVAPLASHFHHFYIPGLIIPVLSSWCCIPVDRLLVLYACVIFLVLYSWFYISGFIFLVLYFWLCIPGFIILVLYACFTFLVFPGFTFLDLYSWLHIPGFIFLVLYCWLIFLALHSWFYIPDFIFLVLFLLCIPGFIFLVLYAWFYIPAFILRFYTPGFIFLVYVPGFRFLALHSWYGVPGFWLNCGIFLVGQLLTFSLWAPPGPDFPILGHPLEPIIFLRESRPVLNIQPLGASRARFPDSGPPSKIYHFLKRKSASY